METAKNKVIPNTEEIIASQQANREHFTVRSPAPPVDGVSTGAATKLTCNVCGCTLNGDSEIVAGMCTAHANEGYMKL